MTSRPEEAEVRELRESMSSPYCSDPAAPRFVALCDSWLAQGRVIEAARRVVETFSVGPPEGGVLQRTDALTLLREQAGAAMNEAANRRRLAWLLEDRARLVRIVGLTCWSQLPAQAKTAFDSFAPILDEAAAVLSAESSPSCPADPKEPT